MSHRSTLYKKKLKEQDPAKFQEFLEKKRIAAKRRRDEKKRRWEEEQHTRAQVEQREVEIEEKRARERERYHQKKAEMSRQTRNRSLRPDPERKRPRDMDKDEYRAYRADQRRNQRANMSYQKKVALRMKRREQRRSEREEKTLKLNMDSPQPGPSDDRLRQSVYNLNHSYKKQAKTLGMSHKEYAKATLNLLNPRTPEKKSAIMVEQRNHPCKALFLESEVFEEERNVEGELGIITEDVPEYGPFREEEIAKPAHEKIQLFYCREDISRILPHARYSTKHGPARIMLLTLKQAHSLFCEEEGQIVGLTTFQSLRPRNVRLLGSVPLESCLCVYCTNVRLKIVAINGLLGTSGQIPPEKDMLSFLTCPFEGRWPDIGCIDGNCPTCKNRMRPFHIFCRDVYSLDNVQWEHWERNPEGKMEPIHKTGAVRDMLNELKLDIEEPTRGTSFLQHLFTAYWQYSQFKYCRTNPEEGEIVMVQDFGENRKAAYSSEIKSAHFGKRQITVHPVVCFYRRGEVVVRESLIFLTNDIQHDHQAVKVFTEKSIQHLQKKILIKKLTIWSDGAASQYKGRGSFHDLSLLPYAPQRCYYGSEHGKGEADGETGVMSQALKRATHQGHSFKGSEDMCEFLSANYGNDRRHYFHIENIERVDLPDDLLVIPGTRKYHQFQTVRPYVIKAWRLACFCTACKEAKFDKCVNLDVVGNFTVHKCKPSLDTILNEAFVEPPSADAAQSTSNSSENACPKVGDYVKLMCQIHKATKFFYAVVIDVADESTFSVRFLQKKGSSYTFAEQDDEGLITTGPPDHYSWRVIEPNQWHMDHRQHYTFLV